MDEWRAAGYAGKEHNDKLWEEFRAARDVFFTRRDEHYSQLREQQAQVIEAKKQIIQEAREATAEVRNWVATSNALDALMDRWKAAGNAGRENEQALWEEFNGIRRDFRSRRKADVSSTSVPCSSRSMRSPSGTAVPNSDRVRRSAGSQALI
jgi:hypothetical protein